jgi:hypothetical protein
MARRIVMGQMSNGSYDLRISRRGYDAMTSDVNDFKRISFSALRQAGAKVASTGAVSAMNSWVNLGQTFSNPPPTLAVLKRSGQLFFNYYNNVTGGAPGFWYHTPYCLVLTTTRVRIAPTFPTNATLPSGDKYIWFTLEN